jgi:hypothetical protein
MAAAARIDFSLEAAPQDPSALEEERKKHQQRCAAGRGGAATNAAQLRRLRGRGSPALRSAMLLCTLRGVLRRDASAKATLAHTGSGRAARRRPAPPLLRGRHARRRAERFGTGYVDPGRRKEFRLDARKERLAGEGFTTGIDMFSQARRGAPSCGPPRPR